MFDFRKQHTHIVLWRQGMWRYVELFFRRKGRRKCERKLTRHNHPIWTMDSSSALCIVVMQHFVYNIMTLIPPDTPLTHLWHTPFKCPNMETLGGGLSGGWLLKHIQPPKWMMQEPDTLVAKNSYETKTNKDTTYYKLYKVLRCNVYLRSLTLFTCPQKLIHCYLVVWVTGAVVWSDQVRSPGSQTSHHKG